MHSAGAEVDFISFKVMFDAIEVHFGSCEVMFEWAKVDFKRAVYNFINLKLLTRLACRTCKT
jgi:hypothetical protein